MTISRNILLLVAITFCLFLPSLFGNFVWDDEELIVNNVQIASPDFIQSAFSGAIFNNGGSTAISNFYRPIMVITFGTITHIFGKTAFWFHFFQLSLHILNVCLVYVLFKRKFLPALIFAIHPLNIEPIIYPSALSDTFVVFFLLTTLLSILKYNKLIIFIPLILLTILSKESGLIVVFLGLILSYYHRREVFNNFLFSSLIAVGLYFFLRFGVRGTGFDFAGIFPMQNATLSTRLLTIPKEFFYYLSNFIYPHNLTIAQHWLVNSLSLSDFWIPLAFGLFSIVILYKSNSFFWGAFFIFSLVPILNLIPLDSSVATRWFYLPMIGLLGVLTPYILRFKKIVIIYAIFLAILSLRRGSEWKTPMFLFSADIINNQESFDLQNYYGTELYRLGKRDEAKIHFEKSAALNPIWWVSWSNLCAVYAAEKNYDRARKSCEQSIANGKYYVAFENLAKLLYFNYGHKEGRDFAIEAIKHFPNDQILIQIASSKETSQ